MPLPRSVVKLLKRTWLGRVVENRRRRRALRIGTRSGSFSQHGEDREILDYFGGRSGVYVDVGANDPVIISNTYLLYLHGWYGLTIDPVHRLIDLHRRYRPRDRQSCAAVSERPGSMTFYETSEPAYSTLEPAIDELGHPFRREIIRRTRVEVRRLSDLIDEHLPDTAIDFLSVDTEGHDLSVLRSLDWTRHRPCLVMFETEAGNVRREEGPRVYMESQGYREWRRIGINVIMEKIRG